MTDLAQQRSGSEQPASTIPPDPIGLSDEQLADEICTWSGRIAAAEARVVALVAELDRRGTWAGPGMLSCAHWLVWRTGLGLTAARERVRVAARLQELPVVREAFGAGRMSWSQVRAVTRVAEPEDGVDWPALAKAASGAQLERICRGIRRVQRVAEEEAEPDLARWRMRTSTRYDVNGNLTITIRANAEDGAVILAGLQAVKADLDRQEPPEPTAATEDDSAESSAHEDVPSPAPGRRFDPWGDDSAESSDHLDDLDDSDPEKEPPAEEELVAEEPQPASDGVALLEMARRALDAQRAEHPDVTRRTRSALVAQVDPLSGWGRLADGEMLPPMSLQQALRALPGRDGVVRLRPLSEADLPAHDLGRTTREVSLALRELLGALDGERCRFPGCTRDRKLQAHHVVYWSKDGPTDLANLVLLCSRHHTLVHAEGFQLTLHADRRLDVTTADAVRVLHHPAPPWGDPAALDPTGRITAETGAPTTCEARMDLGYVVAVLRQQAA